MWPFRSRCPSRSIASDGSDSKIVRCDRRKNHDFVHVAEVKWPFFKEGVHKWNTFEEIYGEKG